MWSKVSRWIAALLMLLNGLAVAAIFVLLGFVAFVFGPPSLAAGLWLLAVIGTGFALALLGIVLFSFSRPRLVGVVVFTLVVTLALVSLPGDPEMAGWMVVLCLPALVGAGIAMTLRSSPGYQALGWAMVEAAGKLFVRFA